VNARRLYAERGYSSLYAYCTEALHMSEAVAYQRIQVAKAARRLPALLERIRSGELHLSGAKLLAPHLTETNHAELLDLARHKSKRAIEELVADRSPKPDVPALVRKLPEAGPLARRSASRPKAEAVPSAPVPSPPRTFPTPPTRPPEPLGRERYKVQFTASRGLREKLREAQALLRHQVPDGDLAQIFERALTLLVKEAKRRKYANVDRPRSKKRSPGAGRTTSRHVPAEIRRAVQARDESRCAFVSSTGHRCGARDFLEFHHREPWARARRHAVENLELRCRAHNQWAAVQDFGTDFMTRFRRPDLCELVPGPVERGLAPRDGID
jgi:5-methylcytosine-specific restriction endonuclease McrA